jgi:hypothetical protein
MHAQTINIHFGRSSPHEAALLASLFAGLASEADITGKAPAAASAISPAPSPLTPPAIGKYWLGQGGVYAGLGRGYDGKPDHHLIVMDAAPTRAKRQLGTYGVDVAGACSIHDGMANTIALAKAGSELCAEILALEVDGHNDFYLMSRADGHLLMANVPELFEKDWYWTSTQYSSYYAWFQDFGDGYQYNTSKKSELLGRPVRRLIL